MLSLDTQAIVVRNAQRAAKFWTDQVGLELRAHHDHWVTVAPKGSVFEIHLCETTPLEKGNTGIGFSAKSVAAEEKRLRANGVKITMKTTKKPWGTMMQFADLDGNRFWVSEG